MQVDLSTTPDLRLTRAILIYSSSREEAVATDHNVVGNQIQPGRPLDLDAFRENLAGLKAPSTAAAATGFTYHKNLIAESRDYRVWYTYQQERPLFIKGKPTKCWLPALVWCGHKRKRSLFVWGGYATPYKPWEEAVLHRPQLSHHVHGDGNVCLGNMNLPDFLPSTWEAGFYDTSFQDPIPSEPYEIKKQAKHGTLKDCLALVARLEARDQSEN